MNENEPLLQKTVPLLSASALARAHLLPLQELFAKLSSSPEGLSNREAANRRESAAGLNIVPPPIKCPSWVCCLLPCVLSFESMKTYHAVVPEHALVKRDRVFIMLDSTSIVPGDVIHVKEGDYVPADLRIIKTGANGQCMFDTSALNGPFPEFPVDANKSSENMLLSPNIAFLGYRCTAGECLGVVIATGRNTVLSNRIEDKLWPPNVQNHYGGYHNSNRDIL